MLICETLHGIYVRSIISEESMSWLVQWNIFDLEHLWNKNGGHFCYAPEVFFTKYSSSIHYIFCIRNTSFTILMYFVTNETFMKNNDNA